VLEVAHLVEELFKELNVDEKRGSVGKLVGNHVQEGFRAEYFTLRASFTSLRPQSRQAQFQDV
jgi:hypothetical protein